MFTMVKDFIAQQRKLDRRAARAAHVRKYGFLHASGFAVGSAKSRTPKRAAQRARRRAAKLEALRTAQRNPAGSKLARATAKHKLGFRVTYDEAVAWHKTGAIPERETP